MTDAYHVSRDALSELPVWYVTRPLPSYTEDGSVQILFAYPYRHLAKAVADMLNGYSESEIQTSAGVAPTAGQ